MNRDIRTILLTVLAGAVLIGGGLLWFIYHGVSAQEDPSAMETALANWVRNASVSVSSGTEKNPIPQTPENLKEGREDFENMCAGCHANNGSGTRTMAAHMYPRSPDLRAKSTQDLTDAEIFYIIRNGIRLSGMPAWPRQTTEDNWKLVLFIRHLPALRPDEE